MKGTVNNSRPSAKYGRTRFTYYKSEIGTLGHKTKFRSVSLQVNVKIKKFLFLFSFFLFLSFFLSSFFLSFSFFLTFSGAINPPSLSHSGKRG